MGTDYGPATLSSSDALHLYRELKDMEATESRESIGLTSDNRLVLKKDIENHLGKTDQSDGFLPYENRLKKAINADRPLQTVQVAKIYTLKYLCDQHMESCLQETLREDLQELYDFGCQHNAGPVSEQIKTVLMAEQLVVEEKREVTKKLYDANWENEPVFFGQEERMSFRYIMVDAASHPEMSQIAKLTSGSEADSQNVSNALTLLSKLPSSAPSAFTSQAAHTILWQCSQDGNKHLLNQFYEIVRAWPEDQKEAFREHWDCSGLSAKYQLQSLENTGSAPVEKVSPAIKTESRDG